MAGVSTIQGVVIRATPLDANGVPQPDRAIVTNGFTRVQSAVQSEAGTTTTVRNAAGGICFTDTSPDVLTGTQLTIDFCKVDPALFSLVSTARPVGDCEGDIAGFQQGTDVGEGQFALEIWARVAKADGGGWMYTVFPQVSKGSLGGTLEWSDGPQTYTLVAPASSNPAWDDGPYGVLVGAGGAAPAAPAAAPWAPAGDVVALCDPVDDDSFVYSVQTAVPPPEPHDGTAPAVTLADDVSADAANAAAAAMADLVTLKGDVAQGDGNFGGNPFTSGQYIVLVDGSRAHYGADNAWHAGMAN